MHETKENNPSDSETVEKTECPETETQPSPETEAKKKQHHKKNQEKHHKPEEELEAAKKEIAEWNDKYLRTLAEMDNFRKRVIKEKEDFRKYILSEFLLEMLQVFDNLDRALRAKSSGSEQAVIDGVEITVKQFLEVMKNYQVQEIEALGKPFDPELHEALAKEERPGVEEPTVVEVYQRGFMLNQRLLRPALTKVALPAAKTEPDEKNIPS